MTDIRDDILNNLIKSKDSLEKTKKTLSNLHSQTGYIENLVEANIFAWEKLKSLPMPTTPVSMASGATLSQAVLDEATQLQNLAGQPTWQQSLAALGSVSQAMTAVTYSGTAFMQPNNPFQQDPFQPIVQILDHAKHETDIKTTLQGIDQSLADEYENAWNELYSGITDPTRSPMFLIREVVTRLYDHFASDQDVKAFYFSDSNSRLAKAPNERPTRRERIQYIASTLPSPKNQAFLAEVQAFVQIYDGLSKAHARKSLDVQQTKGFLYQADELIRLLLVSKGIL